MWPESRPNQPLRRPHFSPRQLVTPADLNAGVTYLVERARRHNRYLHGCGVVCGLELTAGLPADQATLAFSVGEGAAIGPQGDLITVPPLPSLTFNNASDGGAPVEITWFLTQLAAGATDKVELHLLLRHQSGPPSDIRPQYPDLCRIGEGAVVPTRLADGYGFELSVDLPPDCGATLRPLCVPALDQTHPEHITELMNLFGCRPPDPADEWLVVGSVEMTPANPPGGVAVTVHYRYRTLLPSARALLELLRCYPELPRIDSATVTAGFFGHLISYGVTLSGVGLAPLVGVEVEGVDLDFISFNPNQQTDRQIEFFIISPFFIIGSRAVRVETEFDVLDSTDCGVWAMFSEDTPEAPPGGVIGGGNL